MLKDYFEVPNKPAIKSGNVLSCDFTDHETFIPQPLDFIRNTLATYVDCNGIIKVSGVSDTELVTNGDFSNGSTDWTINPAWSIANGKAFYDATINSQRLKQNIVTDASKTYQIKFTISGVESGKFARFGLWVISNASSKLLNYVQYKDGDYVIYASPDGASGNVLHFNAINSSSSDSSFYITNISLKEVDLNFPRIDYLTEIGKAKELQKPSLLLEPQSTNVITYSEDFSKQNIPWNPTSGAVNFEYNSIIAPDNETKAAKILKTSTRVYGNFFTGQTITSAVDYSWSCFFKAGTHSIFTLQLTQGDTEFKAYFDLDNQTSGMYTGSATTKIENYGNGWFRCSLAGVSSTTDLNVRFNLGLGYTTSNENWPSASDGEGLFGYIWGAQLEQQSYVTSYIPTFNSTVTRNQDVCNNAGQLGVFNDTEGVLYLEIAFNNQTTNSIAISDNSNDNRVTFSSSGALNRYKYQLRVGNAAQCNFHLPAIDNTQDFNKYAVTYKPNYFSVWCNGVRTGQDASGITFPSGTLNTFLFARGANNHDRFNGRIRQVKAFRRTLTDSEMTELTNNIT